MEKNSLAIEKDIKVSVIVTIFNTPELVLKKCIESLLVQSLLESEFILVDDGSTDNSGKICDEYALMDNRIRVVHKKNAGLSAARNTGFFAAKGEWVMFVDGDDWIEKNTCKDIYKLAALRNVDVVIFGTIQEICNSTRPFEYRYSDGAIFEGEDCKRLLRDVLDFSGNIATVWAKLFNRDFLIRNNILHDEDLRQGSEGVEFNVRLFRVVSKVLFTNKEYYHYVYNPNSISAKHDEKNHYYVLRCLEKIKHEIQDEDYDFLYNMWCSRVASVVIAAAVSGYFSPLNNESYRLKKRHFKNYYKESIIHESVKCKSLSLSKQRRFVLFLLKIKAYPIVVLIARIRYRQKHANN